MGKENNKIYHYLVVYLIPLENGFNIGNANITSNPKLDSNNINMFYEKIMKAENITTKPSILNIIPLN